MKITDGVDNDFIEKIKEFFPCFTVKKFEDGFSGVIGQLDLGRLEKIHNILNKNIEDTDEIENNIIDFSKLFRDKIFGYILMECFGGICYYEGFVVKNGEKIFNQEGSKDGYINILNKINNKYKKNYFEPFTREFIYENV